jgi:adenylate cyclase
LPEPYDTASGDRLSGDEIRSLVLGHTLNYRNIGIERGMKASTAFSTNGDATLSRPDGVKSGIYVREWASVVEDRAICVAWEAFGPECAAIFRNPTGTAAERNEFLWISDGNPWSFSIAR